MQSRLDVEGTVSFVENIVFPESITEFLKMEISHFKAFRSLLLLLVLTVVTSVTLAEDFQVGSIHIGDPFSRALPPTSKNGAVYLTLTNHGHNPDQLVGAATPIAEHAEMHTHRMEDGMMKMRKVDQVELPPHEEVEFAPGGNHIMLIGLSQPLKEGERFQMMLHFKEAGHVMVEVAIESAGATSASHSEHGHGDSQKHQAEANENSMGHDHGSPAIQVHVAIEGGKVADDQGVIKVTQGTHVTFHFSSDEAHILHVHGYDIEVEVGPGSHSIVDINATATGRFPIKIHGSSQHHALLYIEVHPK